jgi:two-component system LytT family response regulator
MKAILVEDEPYVLQLNKQMLEKTGIIELVATFVNPAEAIPAIITLQPEILFIDIEMPGMNGFHVIDAVIDQVPQLEIVFITSYPQYALKAFEVHALDYLVKPLTSQQVQRLLTRLLNRRQLMSQRVEDKPQQPFTIQLFGRFKIISPSGLEEVKWLSAKSEELLLFLLVQTDYSATKEAIIDALWPEVDSELADINFHTSMHRLKKTLLAVNYPIGINKQNGRYHLILDHVTCDKVIFDRGIKELARFNIGIKKEFEAWFEIYQGQLLEHYPYPWLHAYRQHYLQQYVDLLRVYFETNKHLHSDNEIERILLRAIKFSPLEEELQDSLLFFWCEQGKHTLFIRHYKQLQELWRSELDAEPPARWQVWYQELVKEK